MAFSVEEKYIRKAESELGLKFQKSYIEKLCNENGGKLDTEEALCAFFFCIW